MEGSLFISYSHADRPWMQAFQMHLKGMLMDRCRIWTDEDIGKGGAWREALLGNLQQAAAGLVLVSPDYLVSPWCRRELKSIAEAHRKGQLAAAYWVLLKPCGWEWTELADLQVAQDSADHSLFGLPEGEQREMQILRCCQNVARGLTPLLKSGDKVLSAIRVILARCERGSRITLHTALDEGEFSIAGRGLDANGNDVVVNVLTHTPLRRLGNLYLQVCKGTKAINVPSAIRTIDVFSDGDGYDQRIVIVSEMACGRRLSEIVEEDAKLPASERHLTLDNIFVLLRRLAEALEALHLMEPIQSQWQGTQLKPYKHLMGPLRTNKIFYDRVARRPLISLVSVTNFLWQFLAPEIFLQVIGLNQTRYLLPEKGAGPVDETADQYFLGMLALELLLEGKPLFSAANPNPGVDPRAILESARVAKRHQQFREVVSRLLAEDPKQRFKDMTEVVSKVRGLEEQSRALAKYSFREYVVPDVERELATKQFAGKFYNDLFTGSPKVKEIFETQHQKRAPATEESQREIPDEIQQRKLVDGLKAVLNFRPGGDPSSIDSVAARHSDFNLDRTHFELFEASFIKTLERRVIEKGDQEDIEEFGHMTEAWKDLFKLVREEMLARSPKLVEPHAESASA